MLPGEVRRRWSLEAISLAEARPERLTASGANGEIIEAYDLP